jgi:hypothetical protein
LKSLVGVGSDCVLLGIEVRDARLDFGPWRGAIVNVLIKYTVELVRWHEVRDVALEALVLLVKRIP